MDIPTKKTSPMDTSTEEAWKAWTKERGVVRSPDPAGLNFDLDSTQTSQSLPSFQITRGNQNPLASACPCAVDCNSQCCKSARVLLNTRTNRDVTPLLSPVKNTGSVQRSESPVGSYGSTDSNEQLITVEEFGGVSVCVGVGVSFSCENLMCRNIVNLLFGY